jgi:tetratricopeptide (TPR) repeat protein
MNCPDENIWFDVAGGRLSPAESLTYIQHAATCASCAQKLRTANRIFEDELSAAEESTINSLPSSNPDRQRELAEMLGKVSKAQEDKKGLEVKQTLRIPWRRLLLYAIPATACVIVGLLVSNSIYVKGQVQEVQAFVDSEYGKGRPGDYRLAGMPYQRNRGERGPANLLPFIEIPKSVIRTKPLLAGEAAFLNGEPRSAKEILERACRSCDTSAMTLNDLAVATAMEADTTRSQADYEKALALLDEALKQRPGDAAIYFNRARIFERLKRSEDARKALEQFRRFERDPGWLAEAERMLPSS